MFNYINEFQKNKFNILIISLSLSINLLAGCQSVKKEISTHQNSDKLIAMTTFTILADMAKNVSGDRIIVNSITKQGAEIHGYQPTPSDLVKASKADLIIENGLGLELWAKKFTSAAGDVPKVVLTDGITPMLIEGDIYANKPNPHAWMSPKRAVKYVDNIVDAFIELDPSGKKIYSSNGSLYKSKLLELDKELRDSLSLIPKSKRVLVSCEGAFSYLAKDYGMEEVYLWPVNAESQVTPKRMLRVINKIKERAVPAVFCESTVSSKAQKEVAKSSGAKFGGIFYVDSLSGPDGPASTLLELQRHNVGLIQKGLASESSLK